MRRISRIDRPIGLLRIHSKARIPSTYQCLACKHRSTPLSTSSLRPAPSDEKAPFTEKIRQKLWGTDQPPGLDDPYGDGSFFDKTKKGPRQQKVEVRGQEPVQAPVEVEETTEGYKENFPDDTRRATTWDGLNWVGGGPIWQPEEEFEGYLPADAATHPEVITAALHRALVEVFALQQAGKPLHWLSKQFPETDGVDDWTDNVQITPSSSGATIQMPEHSSLQEVMESLAAPEVNETIHEPQPTEAEEDVHADRSEVDPLKRKESHEPQPTESEEDVHADRSEVDPLKPGKSGERVSTAPIPAPAELIEADEEIVAVRTFEDVISSWDPSWLEISLENPDIKFAVLKRTMQLTGIQFPDAAIKSSNTANSLLKVLVTPPKPRKLFEALEKKEDLLELPNVKIYEAKRTFFAKERDIGRLKVIEEELQAKGLEL